jgi:hypothetical protein
MKQNLILAGLVLVVALVGGLYLRAQVTAPQKQLAGASPAGSSFSNAKFAGKAVAPATAGENATSTSILNTDANDRIVTVIRAGCQNIGTSRTAYTGAGLSAFTLSVGTSSTAAPAAIPSVLVGGGAVTIGTSTVQYAVASSTSGSEKNYVVWPANSYMTFWFNATNTAACTVGVDYLAS